MRWLVDCFWLCVCLIASPLLAIRLARRGGLGTLWRSRRGHVDAAEQAQASDGPHVLLAAVSVGEVNALRALVPLLVQSGARVTIAVTTDTGMVRARSCFSQNARIVRFPLDLSRWVDRFLDAVTPDVVALVELEVWPNFTGACARRGIPVQVIGGRLSARSFSRYRLIRPLVRPMFARLAGVHAQDEEIAERFTALGVPPDRVAVASSLKWDTLPRIEHDEAESFARRMGIDCSRPLVVVGSSAPEEHECLRDAVPDGVQLLCAPRRPEWWDDAAQVLDGCARWSEGATDCKTDRFLLDAIGVLSIAYHLADVVVIGRSLGLADGRHGSDPIEPAALGKPVICGPAMDDFNSSTALLSAAEALCQVRPEDLRGVLQALLEHPDKAKAMGQRGADAIAAKRGASVRACTRLLALAASTAH